MISAGLQTITSQQESTEIGLRETRSIGEAGNIATGRERGWKKSGPSCTAVTEPVTAPSWQADCCSENKYQLENEPLVASRLDDHHGRAFVFYL
jgi:hypothetical protein